MSPQRGSNHRGPMAEKFMARVRGDIRTGHVAVHPTSVAISPNARLGDQRPGVTTDTASQVSPCAQRLRDATGEPPFTPPAKTSMPHLLPFSS
jgi:hypothetical protein